jgi:hypothetical protein
MATAACSMFNCLVLTNALLVLLLLRRQLG